MGRFTASGALGTSRTIAGLRFPPPGFLRDLLACPRGRADPVPVPSTPQARAAPRHEARCFSHTVLGARGFLSLTSHSRALQHPRVNWEPPQFLPRLCPMVGVTTGLGGGGCMALPDTPPGTPWARSTMPGHQQSRGGGSAGLAGADRGVTCLDTNPSLRRLLGCRWLLQGTKVQSRGVTQSCEGTEQTQAQLPVQLEELGSPGAGSRAVELQRGLTKPWLGPAWPWVAG